jgi:hypothetical protein
MSYVFDSSELLNIVRVLGEDALRYLISTLTLHEVGNALWREATLLTGYLSMKLYHY